MKKLVTATSLNENYLEGFNAVIDKINEKVKILEEKNKKLHAMLVEGEDIISGLEAEADNAGINMSEARFWWTRANTLLYGDPK